MKKLACIAGAAGLLIASSALAADTGQLPCKTTQECNENAAKIGANAPSGALPSTSKADAAEDQFYWLNKINKASTVMLVEENIFPKDVGQLIAKGVDYTIKQAQQPDGKRPSDVLQIEKIMTDKVGEQAPSSMPDAAARICMRPSAPPSCATRRSILPMLCSACVASCSPGRPTISMR
ncbi:hypothetical protein [Bradyrhizobium viridifuturi]|uniref:hypothetical protein n=1 Tax=Bradyrhizobium viridifuturi TaxID=1654716 RepID=UPI000A3E0F3A|nr:hypothetical protein [Bradyrhizobium viridifuturi]